MKIPKRYKIFEFSNLKVCKCGDFHKKFHAKFLKFLKMLKHFMQEEFWEDFDILRFSQKFLKNKYKIWNF